MREINGRRAVFVEVNGSKHNEADEEFEGYKVCK